MYIYKMTQIQQNKYIILDFSDLEDSPFKMCLGVIGYLFVLRQGYHNISYVSSQFIRSMNAKSKKDLIKYLTDNDYIRKQPSTTANTQYYIITGLTKTEKKDANLYLVMPKLRNLKQVFLDDIIIENWVDKHIHLLSNQYFNHFEHSYKWIKIKIPYEERIHYNINQLNIIDRYGDSITKDYEITKLGYDHTKFAGTHFNIFTLDRNLLKYTSLIDPIEIGFLYSIPVILADQMYKIFGENDYSNFFMKRRFTKGLFHFITDYYIFQDIFYQQFYSAIYGYELIKEFNDKFPNANQLLWRIKNGGRGLELPFIGFTKDIKPKILKSDVRLHLECDHPAISRGQPYYRIVPLVCMIREVQIMRQIWKRLKKCNILFLPLTSSVVVERQYEVATSYIVNDILKHNIHPKIKFVVQKNYLERTKQITLFGNIH